ncbi:MAG TPA: hypothetical protein VHE12_03730 [bacterium]|nr:hypothetical protein [bacterium]
MNSFAQPEEANSYEFPEFPKPADQVTEYANVEGAVDYQFKDMATQEPYVVTNDTPTVYPAVFQDFKQILQG